jgi:translation initiation factor 6
MTVVSGDILGHSQAGVYAAVLGDVLFLPLALPKSDVEDIEAALELESVQLTIGGSNLIGSLIEGNSHGMGVADIAGPDDIDRLTSFGDVVVMESSVNAAGNLLLANENGVLASPVIPEEGLEILSDAMKVPAANVSVAGQDVIGSLGACNDMGVVLHPDVAAVEVEIIEKILGVPAMVGTVSFGSPLVGAGLVCSNNGAFAGGVTTGPELNRIEDALGLI